MFASSLESVNAHELQMLIVSVQNCRS